MPRLFFCVFSSTLRMEIFIRATIVSQCLRVECCLHRCTCVSVFYIGSGQQLQHELIFSRCASRCLGIRCSTGDTNRSIRTEAVEANSEGCEAFRRQHGSELLGTMGKGTEAAEAKNQGREAFRRGNKSKLSETMAEGCANAE